MTKRYLQLIKTLWSLHWLFIKASYCQMLLNLFHLKLKSGPRYIVCPSRFCLYLHHTVTADPGSSFSPFAAILLLSTRLGWDCSWLKKSGLSKVLDFFRRGKWQPDFLMIKKMMTVPMAITVMTSTAGKVTWPLPWGSTAGFTVQIQHMYDEPEEQNYYYDKWKELRDLPVVGGAWSITGKERSKIKKETLRRVQHFFVLLNIKINFYWWIYFWSNLLVSTLYVISDVGLTFGSFANIWFVVPPVLWTPKSICSSNCPKTEVIKCIITEVSVIHGSFVQPLQHS